MLYFIILIDVVMSIPLRVIAVINPHLIIFMPASAFTFVIDHPTLVSPCLHQHMHIYHYCSDILTQIVNLIDEIFCFNCLVTEMAWFVGPV